nr:MAG TPA: hypothetical protein [Caudoviricetes sp.]
MNIILNHKHDAEIQFQLDKANHLARIRTVDIDEVYGAVTVLERKFEDCTKKSMEGLIVHVDLNSQDFPNAYHGIPMSTHFVLIYEKRSWRFIRAERLRCGWTNRYEVSYLPDPMREELLKRFKSFDR